MTVQHITFVQGFLLVSARRIQHFLSPFVLWWGLLTTIFLLWRYHSHFFINFSLIDSAREFTKMIPFFLHSTTMRWGLTENLQFLVPNLSYLRNFQIAFCSNSSCLFKSGLISSLLTQFNLLFTLTLSPSCPSHALLSPSPFSSQTPTHHWKSVSLFTSHPTKLQYKCPQQSLPLALQLISVTLLWLNALKSGSLNFSCKAKVWPLATFQRGRCEGKGECRRKRQSEGSVPGHAWSNWKKSVPGQSLLNRNCITIMRL